jgi:hypothetical protein
VPKNLKLVSIHDVLTSREARSDPTGSRARIRGEPRPEPEPPLHGRALSGVAAPEAKTPLYGWALSKTRRRNPSTR